ncbi:serine/threonine-protein kinase [uncultured Paludibaculum sp.]|uniref:serine/threonine protein kinase n=1 Tax=uncultured Paludibaculum sp. TaxID=1765020 RepID=UPI002AAC2833|nr:serine/threonine-protein kinase [uncultured Paludibaculum sp.]
MIPSNLCPNCFEQRDSAAACPACGWSSTSQPDSPFYLWPGTILKEQYVIGKVLGHGGFGITYMGWDLNLARRIAIKEYFPAGVAARMTGNPSVFPHSKKFENEYRWGLERYLEEARTVARFQNHPFIVWVQNFFSLHGTAYLILEYLEGATLDQCLKEWGHLDFATAFRVMMPVMDALREVHSIGLLHRDISPDNIFILHNGQIKVIDFGAARYALGQQSQNLSVILKHGYAPPEQYETRGDQGAWTDVYAVAATMYRTMTGEIPPSSPDRQANDTLQPPSAKGASIPPGQEAALMKALALRPAERYRDMPSFLAALRDGEQPSSVRWQALVEKTKPSGDTGKFKMTGPGSWQEKQRAEELQRQNEKPPQPVKQEEEKKSKPWIIWALVAAIALVVTVGGAVVYHLLNPAQKIERFDADPTEIEAGQEAKLTWAATGVKRVILDGIGPQDVRGSLIVRPAQTTKYRLIAGLLDSWVEVKVKPAQAPPPTEVNPAEGFQTGEGERKEAPGKDAPRKDAPGNVTPPASNVQVTRCEIQPAVVRPGQQARLIWETRGAQSVSLEPDHRQLQLSGFIDFKPQRSTTVQIVARASQASATCSASVTVEQAQAPPQASEVNIVSFNASPVRLQANQRVTLSWQILNSTGSRIEPGIGPLQHANGQVQVVMQQTTRFVLTAYNAQGQQASRFVDVVVVPGDVAPPPRQLSFEALHHHSGWRFDLRNFHWDAAGRTNVCRGMISLANGTISFHGSNNDGFAVPYSEVAEVSINPDVNMGGSRVFLIRLASGKKYNFLTRMPIEQAVAAIRQTVGLKN